MHASPPREPINCKDNESTHQCVRTLTPWHTKWAVQVSIASSLQVAAQTPELIIMVRVQSCTSWSSWCFISALLGLRSSQVGVPCFGDPPKWISMSCVLSDPLEGHQTNWVPFASKKPRAEGLGAEGWQLLAVLRHMSCGNLMGKLEC